MTKRNKRNNVHQLSPPTIYNAFDCPRGHWVEVNKDGTVKQSTANAIVALRFLLEDKNITLKYDNWRKYHISIPPIPVDPISQWRNEIYERHHIMFSPPMLKDARLQLSVKNQIHSQIEYYASLKWDNGPRIEQFVRECLKLDGTPLELCVIRMQLVASVRRVVLPGTAYDLVPCLLSPQGYMKSKMLSILYGEANVLAEDISCASTKVQSEKTRHGINCVELPDTLGDNSKLSIKRIKAFVTNRFEIGRDAYGRVENIRPIGRSYVIWHTGNDFQFLADETGNRRFIPMRVYNPIDEPWIRANRDQLWAEAVELERQGRHTYYEENANIPKNDEKFPDIFLPEGFYEEAAQLQQKHMRSGIMPISYESMLADLINQPFVIREPKITWVKADDVRTYLHISETKWISASKEITALLKKLNWDKAQIFRNNYNWRGYKY